jgi:hypothetical protein
MYCLNPHVIVRFIVNREIAYNSPLSLKRQVAILLSLINCGPQAFIEYNRFGVPVGDLPPQPVAPGFPGIADNFSNEPGSDALSPVFWQHIKIIHVQ